MVFWVVLLSGYAALLVAAIVTVIMVSLLLGSMKRRAQRYDVARRYSENHDPPR